MSKADNSRLPDYKSLNENARRECARLRAEVERLKDEARHYAKQTSTLANVHGARAQSAEAALAELRQGFECIFSAAEAWCNAVDKDSSWDGWDRHFKEMKWQVLPALRSLLPTSTDKGGDNGVE